MTTFPVDTEAGFFMGWFLLLIILLLITLPNLVAGLYLGCALGYGPPNVRASVVLIAEICRLDTLGSASWREIPATLAKEVVRISALAGKQIAALPGRFLKRPPENHGTPSVENKAVAENTGPVPPTPPSSASEQLDQAVAEVKATDVGKLVQDNAASEIPTPSPVRELRENDPASLKGQTNEAWLMAEKNIETSVEKLKAVKSESETPSATTSRGS